MLRTPDAGVAGDGFFGGLASQPVGDLAGPPSCERWRPRAEAGCAKLRFPTLRSPRGIPVGGVLFPGEDLAPVSAGCASRGNPRGTRDTHDGDVPGRLCGTAIDDPLTAAELALGGVSAL